MSFLSLTSEEEEISSEQEKKEDEEDTMTMMMKTTLIKTQKTSDASVLFSQLEFSDSIRLFNNYVSVTHVP
jgi:hypothetical protein